jgi:hypothetical protein
MDKSRAMSARRAGGADIFLVSAARIIQMIRGQIPPKHPIHEEN